jgi:LysM domain-containing protein
MRDIGVDPTRYCSKGAFMAVRRRRVYLRRRMASIAVVTCVAVGTMMIGGSAPASRHSAPRAIVVSSGQTLWDIADRYAPEGVDPRAYIDAVVTLNGLEGVLHSGQRLKLPR